MSGAPKIRQLGLAARRWHWGRIVIVNVAGACLLWTLRFLVMTHEWHAVPATVVSAEAVAGPEVDPCFVIRYRYVVEGQAYVGDRLTPAGRCVSPRPEWFERFPPGRLLKVYYDVDDPAFAAIVPQYEWGALGMWFAFAGMIAFVNAFLVHYAKYRFNPQYYDTLGDA